MNLPNQPSQSTIKRNPHIYDAVTGTTPTGEEITLKVPVKAGRQPTKALNKTEARYRDILVGQGFKVLEQAITLRLSPPFSSYRADLAYVDSRGGLVLVEVKAKHQFFEKGVAKASLAANVYRGFFRIELAVWAKKCWTVTILSP